MRTSLLLSALLLAAPAASRAAPPAEIGDLARGAALFRLHCAACHGRNAAGDGPLSKSLTRPPPTNLRQTAFLLSRGNEELAQAITGGGPAVGAHPTMPAFGKSLTELEVWDLLAFIRRGQLEVSAFFPEATRYATKVYQLDADRQRRLEPVLGKLRAEEQAVPLVAVFKGLKEGDRPIYVPQEPRLLDTLRPVNKLGYLACLPMPLPGMAQPVPTCVAIDKDGVLRQARVAPFATSDADRDRLDKLLAVFQGQGSKGGIYSALSVPKGARGGKELSDLARALTRAYYRTLAAAVMFDKEELDRNPFD